MQPFTVWEAANGNATGTNAASARHRRPRRPLAAAAAQAIELLEGRVLLSVTTTTINHSAGFSGATDIVTNGSVTIPANSLQLLAGTGGETGSGFDSTRQGIDTLDTTFNFDFGTANPQADGFTFTIQNDPAGTAAQGGGGGFLGYQGITNSVAIKFDLWDGNPPVTTPATPNDSYTASGVYTGGANPADDPRQTLSTTPAPLNTSIDFSKNPDGSATGLNFHNLNASNQNLDQYQVHLVYDGTTLTETVTDLTLNKSATETYKLNISALVNAHTALVGFTAADGGASSTPEVSSWTYTGTASSQLPTPVLTATQGVAGEVDLAWTETAGATPANFRVADSTDGGATFNTLATLPGTATNYQAVGLDPTKTYVFTVTALGDGTTSLDSAPSNAVTVSAAGATPVLSGYGPLPGQAVLNWSETATTETGFELDASTDGGATFAPTATFAPGSSAFTLTGLDPTKTYEFKMRALGNGTTTSATAFSDVVTVNAAGPSSKQTIDFSNGFTNTVGQLQLNGVATDTGATGKPANAVELTHGVNGGEAGSAFFTAPVGIDTFDTTFQWTYGINANADGFAFTLQNNSPTALGGTGGNLGYNGIGNSVAIAFNLYNNVDQTAFASGGQNVLGTPVDLTMDPTAGTPTGIDFHANKGDTFQAHLVYDGTTLTETVTDQTLIAQGKAGTFTTTYTVGIPTLVGSHTAFIGFTGADGGALSQQDILNWKYRGTFTPTIPAPVAVANSSVPGTVDVGWTDTVPASGFEVDESTDGGTTFNAIATLPASANFDEVTGLTAGTSYQFRVKALGVGPVPTLTSNTVTITPVAAAPSPIDFSGGFTTTTGLQLNGSAAVTNNQLQLTTNTAGQAGSAFATTAQSISGFDTTFDFTYVPNPTGASADGFTFVIQNSPAGDTALGPNGGGLGYGPANNANGNAGGIPNSVAIKFDLFQNNVEGTNSTGLFTNGDAPTSQILANGPDITLDLTPSGVVLGKTDTYHVELSYDGSTLHEVLTDTTTNQTFTHDYAINLSQFIKGNSAFVGFAGGTGGLTAEQDILNWRFSSTPPTGGAKDVINDPTGGNTITLKKDGNNIDWTIGSQSGNLPITDVKGLTINDTGGADTIVLDNSAGDPLPNLLTLNGKFAVNGLQTIGTGQKVDIQNSTVQINYTGATILPAVQSALKSGQIFSSTLASNPRFAIADTDSADPLNSGQAANSIVLRPAVIGNATLSGKVGFNDVVQLARNFGKSNADWSMGDFNYDGTVNFADLVALARNYNQSGPAASPATTAALTPAVATATTTQKQTRRPLSTRLG